MLDRIVHAVHRRLVWVLLATYLLAAIAPGPALLLRTLSAGAVRAGGGVLELRTPTLLLELLLFNASLGVDARALGRLARDLRAVVLGLVANSALPILYVLVCAVVLARWHDVDEVQSLLVGLAFVGAMPIAGSSTAWSQNAEGNVALSLGLVLASTVVSPLLTPLAFRIVAHVTIGDYSEDLSELASGSTQLFLVLAVIAPSLAGIMLRAVVGGERLRRAMPLVKLVNTVVLVALNYLNAAVSLPAFLKEPDLDLLALVLSVTTVLCAGAFFAGRLIGRLARAGEPERVSLMFGLGMNNNGSGLVLATTMMADHRDVLLTIVTYNLVQQIVAGIFDHVMIGRRRAASEERADDQ